MARGRHDDSKTTGNRFQFHPYETALILRDTVHSFLPLVMMQRLFSTKQGG
jgi:hypothetical protein